MSWRRWAALAAIVLVLLAQRAALDLSVGSFTSDEGLYALQARALEDGRWTVEDRFLEAGPDGRRTVFVGSEMVGGRVLPYAHHPMWPLFLRVGAAAAGDVGMYLLPLLGAVAVPVVAWWAAGAYRGASRAAAFWAAAVSPAVVVNAHVLWAHAPSAALGGVAIGVAARPSGARPRDVAVFVAAVTVGGLLRSEGVLLAGALAVALAVARRWALAAWAAGAGAAVVLAELVLTVVVGGGAERIGVRGGAGDGFLLDRLAGAAGLLFAWAQRPTGSLVLPVVVAVAAAVAGWAAAGRVWRVAGIGAAVASVGWVVLWAVDPSASLTGLLGAWPVGAAGFGAMARLRRADVAVVTAGLFVLASIALVYDNAGGVQWGGRYLSPITVVGAVGVGQLWPRVRGAELARVAFVVAGIVTVGFATTAADAARRERADIERSVVAAGVQAAVTSDEFLPRHAWRLYPTTQWVLVGDDAPFRPLPDAIADLRAAGVDRFASRGFSEKELEDAGATVESNDSRVIIART